MDPNHPSEVITWVEQRLVERGLPEESARTAARSRYERLTSDGDGHLQYRLNSGIRVPVATHLKHIEDEGYSVATAEQRSVSVDEIADAKALTGDYSVL